MQVHFVLVGETTIAYLNMIKLLLFSFRENAGIYRDAPITVVTNGNPIPEPDKTEIEERFGVQLRVMPRISTTHVNVNSLNGLYAIESNYDILVYLDCDTAILRPLDDIAAGLDAERLGFAAIPTGPMRIDRHDELLRAYCGFTEEEIQSYKCIKGFNTAYPVFNGGVLVLTHPTVLAIRNDALEFNHLLHSYRMLKRPLTEPLRFLYNNVIAEFFRVSRLIAGTHYSTTTNEIGLALAVLKHRVPFHFLHWKYNWNGNVGNPGEACIVHYMKGMYKLPRDHMFDGNWIEEFAKSRRPVERIMANLVSYYNSAMA